MHGNLVYYDCHHYRILYDLKLLPTNHNLHYYSDAAQIDEAIEGLYFLTANELVWKNRPNRIQTAVVKYSQPIQFAASSMTSSSSGIIFAALGLGIAAILMAGLAIYYSMVAADQPTNGEPPISTITQPTAERQFNLFSEVDENINEEELGIPPDKFSSDTVVVNQGDSVEIHFYNLEPVETQEKHSFTIPEGTYQMHHDVNAGDDVEVEFVANEAGVYDFVCVYHLPTMQGKLVVLPATR